MPLEAPGPVAGVVLAAGASTRMGHNKLFLDLGGQTILRRSVGRAAAAGLHPIIVVLGHEAARARKELSGLPCQPVENPDYQRGLGQSVRAGIDALPTNVSATLVILADMPFVTADMLATMVEAFRTSGAPLVISDYEGVNAPPMLYHRSLFPELRTMKGDGCGREVVRRHQSEAAVVSWPAAALADVDLPEDYERARTRVGAGAG
jgi:molybdenum cofactor cytidylyltransferase